MEPRHFLAGDLELPRSLIGPSTEFDFPVSSQLGSLSPPSPLKIENFIDGLLVRLAGQPSSIQSSSLPLVAQGLSNYLVSTDDVSQLDFEHAAGLGVASFNEYGGPLVDQFQSMMQSEFENYQQHNSRSPSLPADERANRVVPISRSPRATAQLGELTKEAFAISQVPPMLTVDNLTVAPIVKK